MPYSANFFILENNEFVFLLQATVDKLSTVQNHFPLEHGFSFYTNNQEDLLNPSMRQQYLQSNNVIHHNS